MKKIKRILSTTKLKISPKELDKFHSNACTYRNSVDQVEELSSINKKLVAEIFKLVEIEEREVSYLVPETTEEIRENYCQEFINAILNVFKKYNYRIHATSSAEKIMQEGLLVRDDNKEINYTSLPFNDKTDNEILYSLFNDMHKGQKQIIIIDAENEDLVEYKGKYKVPQERIKCYIDIETQTVTYNQNYKQLNRGGERVVERENEEIDASEILNFNSISSQILAFEYLNKTNTRADISETNTRIHEFLMELILQLNKLIVTQEEKEKLIYYISQVDNDVYKSLKEIREREKTQTTMQTKVISNSKFNIENTDDLF